MSTGLLAALTLVTGCGGGSIVPKDGIWHFAEGASATDTCKLNPAPAQRNGPFTMTNNTGVAKVILK